jgi:membrane protein involved in colicin uptake
MTDTTPQPEIVRDRALRIAEQAYETALSVQIDSADMFQTAGIELQAIKSRAKQIEDLRISITRPMDEAKKRVMDMFRTPLERLQEAEGVIKDAMLTWQRAEQERAAQARREAEESARREREAAEAARRQAEQEARKAREAAEAAAQTEDAAAAKAAEQVAAAAEAAAAEATVVAELAEVAPVSAPAVIQPKAAGISTRQNWKFEIVDFEQFVRAAVARLDMGDPTLIGLLLPNDKAIGQVARALKAQMRIPGVRVYAEDALAVRAA